MLKFKILGVSVITRHSLSYRWVILLLFVFSQMILSIVGLGWGSLAPFFKQAMTLNNTQVGMISSVFYLAGALIAFPGGIIVDRYGVKLGIILWLGFMSVPILLLGIVYYNPGDFIQALPQYVVLLALTAIAGLGYGLGNPVCSKGLFIWFSKKEERGTVFGIRQAAVTLGAALAGVLLVYLCQQVGPFSALGIIGLCIIVMLVLSVIFYHDPAGYEIHVNEHKITQNDPKNKPMFFMLSQHFAEKAFVRLSIVMALMGLGQGIVVTFLILFINDTLGFSLLYSGSILALVMISGSIGRVIWGVISDRLFHGQRKPVLIIISLLAAASIIMLACWQVDWPKELFLVVVVGIGLSVVGWNSIALVFVTEISPNSKTATYIGLASTIAWVGVAAGPFVFGGITDYFGYFAAWITLAACFVLSFCCCLSIQQTSE